MVSWSRHFLKTNKQYKLQEKCVVIKVLVLGICSDENSAQKKKILHTKTINRHTRLALQTYCTLVPVAGVQILKPGQTNYATVYKHTTKTFPIFNIEQ